MGAEAAAAVDAAANAVKAAKQAQETMAQAPPSARGGGAVALDTAVKAVESAAEKIAPLTTSVQADKPPVSDQNVASKPAGTLLAL